jgi:tetratricopeptide (TPR) repeat protein
MLGLLFAFAFGIVLMSLRVASYAQVKAIYGMPAIVALCWAAVTGWNWMVERKRFLGWLGGVGLTSWVITICCAFWINSRSPVTAAMRGLNLAAQERFEEAVQEYSRALKLDSDYLPARNGLADALAHAGRVEDALREAELTIQQHPKNAEAQFRLGASLALNGQNREASGRLQQAIALAPDHPGFHQELSLRYSRMKMYREAITACREGLRRYPLDFDLLNNLAWLLATNPDATLRNGNEAVLMAERACQLTSYRKPIYIGTLAAAYAEAGRFDEAIVAGEKARQLCLAAGQQELADQNGKMLELYRAGRAYREQ